MRTTVGGTLAAPVIGTTLAPVAEARSLYRFFRAGDEEVLALRGVSLAVMRIVRAVLVAWAGLPKLY